MFSKLSVVVVAAFAALAVATPTARDNNNQCQTGTQACCDSVQDSSTPEALAALGSIGAQVAAGIPVGITCSAVTVIGIAGGSSCSKQPVCCNKDNFNGVAAIGCTPINAAL